MSYLTKREVVAMWLWGAEYAKSGLSAVDWHKRLEPSRAMIVTDFIKEYEAAASPSREEPSA